LSESGDDENALRAATLPEPHRKRTTGAGNRDVDPYGRSRFASLIYD